MPLFWNSQDDVFIGTLAPPRNFAYEKNPNKLDMSNQAIESPDVHQVMKKKSNNFRVVGTRWVHKTVVTNKLRYNRQLLKNIYDGDNEMERMMIGCNGTVLNVFNTWPVYTLLLWSYWFHMYVLTYTYSRVHTHIPYNMMWLCTDARAKTHASLRIPTYKIYQYLSK